MKQLPAFISPMLAERVEKPFDSLDWIFETKWDGYRAIARIEKGKVELISRNEQRFTGKYPSLIQALKKIHHDVMLDGEIIALDEKGQSQFQALQEQATHTPILFAVFDILFLDGQDLRDAPLIERKKILKKIMPRDKRIIYTHHVRTKGTQLFTLAQKQGMEGIMAKRKESPYVSSRNSDWLKIKHLQTEEAIICGYTEPRGSRKFFGALILGQFKNGTLRYIGHTGTGFTESAREKIEKQLKKERVKKSPFAVTPQTNSPAQWVNPKIVCQIEFTEKTKDGILRQPVFLGLREDKAAREVHPDELTHLDKLFWPKEKITKGDLLAYYNSVASFILPHLKDRPESLNRHPNGILGENFFQKNIVHAPEWIKFFSHQSESEEKEIHWLICNDKNTLLYMVNLGCIEINPWISRMQKPNHPDFLLLDLDPYRVEFSEVVHVAQKIRSVLEKIEVESFIKTSGKRGLHIVVPLGAKYTFEQSRQFAELLSTTVFQEIPEATTLARNPEKRGKSVYIDFLQNRIGQTIAAPYCVRPVPGALVSTPLHWEEITASLRPENFTLKNTLQRLEKEGDLWKPLLNHSGINMLEALNVLAPLSTK